MPKETFNNLSEEKKQRIFDAAVQEFSTRRFSEASINQIVKTAGIPRGSFYQYFKDKADLYLYMMFRIGKEKLEVADLAEALKPDADFFEVFLHLFKSLMSWAREKPLYNQIGLLMEMDDSELILKLREAMPEGINKLKALIERDQQRGLIRKDVDPELVVEMIYTLHMNLLKDYYRTGSDEELLKKVTDIIGIIKGGIASV
ncbi:MAG: TetR/AcrR family transcriptional regulator [Bacillota bacterium]